MLPAILPGSVLRAAPPPTTEFRRGDVVCFVDSERRLVAHRIVEVVGQGGEVVCCVRGDAQRGVERVPRAAIAFKVARVEHPLLAYSCDGVLGRCFAALALAHPILWSSSGKGLRRLASLLPGWRALGAFAS